MKRYEAVMGTYAGLPYIETNQHNEGRFVLYSDAQNKIEVIKAQRDELLGAVKALRDLFSPSECEMFRNTVFSIDDLIERMDAAIAKAGNQ